MSAFICSDKHIATIALLITASTGKSAKFAQSLADMLKRINIESVNFRYAHHGEPEPITQCDLHQWSNVHFNIDTVHKLIQCWQYQSCEKDDCAEYWIVETWLTNWRIGNPAKTAPDIWSI